MSQPAPGSVTMVVSKLSEALGPPKAFTPDHQRSEYREWRWSCPVCHAGENDPLYAPLLVDTVGNMCCRACWAPTEKILREASHERAVRRLLDELDV